MSWLERKSILPTTRTEPQNPARSGLIRICGGALIGSVVSVCAEILLIVSAGRLPVEILSTKAHSPILDLTSVVVVGILSYGGVGALVGACISLLLCPFLARLSPMGALATGVFAGGSFTSALPISVWVGWFHDGPWSDPEVLLRVAIWILGATATWGVVASAAARLLRSWVPVLLLGLILSASLLAAAYGFHRTQGSPPTVNLGKARDGLPDILFVTIDTLRADELGSYGGSARTPFLDRLAAEGTRFSHAISQITWTTPSHVSFFTSLFPNQHGATNGAPMEFGLQTLPLWLRAVGYHTAAFTAAFPTKAKATGLSGHFDVYIDSSNRYLPILTSDDLGELSLYRLINRLSEPMTPASIVISRVEDWLADAPERPFFLWVHFYDVHHPHEPAPEFRDMYLRPGYTETERKRALYRAEITQLDREFEGMFDHFEEHRALDDVIVMVSSDHGEDFEEPHPEKAGGAIYGHGRHVWDSTIQLPLILWGPGRIPAGLVVESQVQAIDVAPTLLDLIGAPIPAGISGRSFLSYLHGSSDQPDRLAFSESAAHSSSGRWLSVRSPEWKLVTRRGDGTELLFDIASDRGETTDVKTEHPEVARRLRDALRESGQLLEAQGSLLLPGAREALRALGYVVDE